MTKTASGRFFEDFTLGEEIHHATPRTVTEADATLYLALTGSRFGVHCSEMLARMAGLPRSPLDDLLTFHMVFGRSVPDVSLNAVANLGYADGRFAISLADHLSIYLPYTPGDRDALWQDLVAKVKAG